MEAVRSLVAAFLISYCVLTPPCDAQFGANDARAQADRGITEGGARPGETDCSNRDISQCTALLEVLTRKQIGFAATRAELNEMCPVLLQGLECIDDYTRRCLNPHHRKYFNELYIGTTKVIKDLCNNRGQYQTEYIAYAPCMRKVHAEYNLCAETYHENTATLNKVNSAVVQYSEAERRKSVITLCCSFQEYLQCSERVVLETCGNATAAFTKEFLNRMAGPIVQTKCSRYEPGSFVCRSIGLSSSTRSVISSTTSLAVCVVFGLMMVAI